jgi:hypothetical protein
MKDRLPSLSRQVVGFTLSDGSTWGIAAGDEQASALVSRLAEAMQLRPHGEAEYRLLVLTDGRNVPQNVTPLAHEFSGPVLWAYLPPGGDNTITCVVSPARGGDMMANQLLQLSLAIAQQVQFRDGFLLHGALMEENGRGVILAGPGGIGKTTASQRLPLPWRSLSDDETLVVRDRKGKYWAHPWPTWSNFMSGGQGGTWDVERAVPLMAIFFMEQTQHDGVESLGIGESTCLLVESAKQAFCPMPYSLSDDEVRAIHLQCFDNICVAVKSVPCYHLSLSLHGIFWKDIEQVI